MAKASHSECSEVKISTSKSLQNRKGLGTWMELMYWAGPSVVSRPPGGAGPLAGPSVVSRVLGGAGPLAGPSGGCPYFSLQRWVRTVARKPSTEKMKGVVTSMVNRLITATTNASERQLLDGSMCEDKEATGPKPRPRLNSTWHPIKDHTRTL